MPRNKKVTTNAPAASAAGESPAQMEEARGLRGRFYFVAALLVPINTFWVLFSEVVRYAGHPTTISLFYNVVFWFCLLLAVNGLIRRFAPRAALSRSELLALYTTLGITSGLAGHDMAEVLLPILSHPARYADGTNSWAETLLPRLPTWLTVTDTEALKPFYEGHASLYTPTNWRLWIVPVLCWSGFLGTLCAIMLCLNVLLRKQWTERERLAFPLVQLPLELTQPGTPLLRDRLLWLGAALAVSLQIWNGIAFLTPSVPMITVKYRDYGSYFVNRPWNAIGWLPVSFYPFAIALGVLLPLDLSFSSWFFYWFWKAQNIFAAQYGLNQIPNFPYVEAQSLGGYLGLAITALWGVRRHLARVFWSLFERGGSAELDEEDADGPISQRAAAWGVVIGSALVFGFCRAAGMTPWIIGAFFGIYLAISVAITRMRAELGPPAHDLHAGGPNFILPQVLGPTNLPRQDLMMFALFSGFNRAYRGHPMPIQLEGFKMAERSGSATRPLFFLMLALGFLGPLTAFWLLLHLGYSHGAAGPLGPPNVLTIFGSEPWNRYNSWMKTPQPPQTNAGIAVAVGMSFVLLLQNLRSRLIGFPFHPVGYAVTSSWSMSLLWMPMLLAWGTKFILLRYGGLGLYRRALPFFYGVILGECVAGSLWTLIGMISGIPTYGFWP